MKHEKLSRHLDMLADCVRDAEEVRDLRNQVAELKSRLAVADRKIAEIDWMTQTDQRFTSEGAAARHFGRQLKALWDALGVVNQDAALAEIKRLSR